MFDSLYIGTSGLQTFSAGLKVISNNVANLNTPGFKASSSTFANLYYAGSGDGSGGMTGDSAHFGSGVTLGHMSVNFRAGELRQTGNPLDLYVNGSGFFVTKAEGTGESLYSRAGQFDFNKDGVLVVRGTENQVMGLSDGGALVPITLDGLRINPPKATTTVSFTGNLSSGAATHTLSSVKVIDSAGGEHTLNLTFTKSTTAGVWTVKVQEGSTDIASGDIKFTSDRPAPGFDTVSFNLSPAGMPSTSIKLDFSSNVTDFNTGTGSSTLAVAKSDGYPPGALTKVNFDEDGTLTLSYANGQSAKGTKLALALFDSTDGLQAQGNAGFTYASREGMRIGAARQGSFGSIGSNQIEGSNVDLASEFSDLIVAQRGYQASSRIVSTANELLQDLFDMKGHR